MVVLDLTTWPEGWGENPATQAYLESGNWEYEPPTCYCCGHTGGWEESSPLALKETEYGTMDLFHYDCYAMNRIKFGKKKNERA
jgi:hypothetical protein